MLNHAADLCDKIRDRALTRLEFERKMREAFPALNEKHLENLYNYGMGATE